jgi:hypothetical protein
MLVIRTWQAVGPEFSAWVSIADTVTLSQTRFGPLSLDGRFQAAGVSPWVEARPLTKLSMSLTGGSFFDGSVKLQMSLDGGTTPLDVGSGPSSGPLSFAQGSFTQPVGLSLEESLPGRLFRWNCVSLASDFVDWVITDPSR